MLCKTRAIRSMNSGFIDVLKSVLFLQLSFGLVKLLQLEGGVALGMFATGCAPGGGASNMYTYLLKGDVSLSVTMTFISTMSALGRSPINDRPLPLT